MQFWQMQLYCGKHGRHCFKYCLSLFWDILTALFTKYSLLLVADEGLAAAEQFKSKSKFKVELSLSCEASFSLHTDGFVTFLASEQNDSFFESIDSMVTPLQIKTTLEADIRCSLLLNVKLVRGS